jgi:hypothetical protein
MASFPEEHGRDRSDPTNHNRGGDIGEESPTTFENPIGFVRWIYSQMGLVPSPDQRTTDGATPENDVIGGSEPHSDKTGAEESGSAFP